MIWETSKEKSKVQEFIDSYSQLCARFWSMPCMYSEQMKVEASRMIDKVNQTLHGMLNGDKYKGEI